MCLFESVLIMLVANVVIIINNMEVDISHVQVSFSFEVILFRMTLILEPPSQSQAPWDITKWIDPIQNSRTQKTK